MAGTRVSGDVVVSLRGVSGDIVWGPGACKRAASVAALRRLAAEALKQPEASVRILQDGTVLQPADTLEAAGVIDGAELGVVLVCLSLEVRQIMRKLRDVVWVSIKDDPCKVPEADVPAKLAEVALACGCKELPADLTTLLQVLLSSGKTIQDNTEQKYDLDEGCTITSSLLVGERAQHQPGLLYLAVDSFDEVFMGCSHWGCVVVDLRGALARLLGGDAEGRGAVWYASLQRDSCRPDAGLCSAPSLEVWQQIVDEGYPIFKHGTPKCIAPDVTEFFRLWATRGRPPQFEVHHEPPCLDVDLDSGPPRCSC